MTRGDLVSLVGSVAPFFMCLSSPTRFATHLILRWLSILKNDLITIKPHLIYHHVLTVCFVFRDLESLFFCLLFITSTPKFPGMTRGDLVSLVGSVAPFFMCLSSPTRFATHLILRWLSVLKNDLITIKPHLSSCFNSLLCLFMCFLGGGGGDFWGGWRILGRSLVCAYILYLKFLSANPKIIVSHPSIHWWDSWKWLESNGIKSPGWLVK